jgi:hypothetical protein
MKWILKIKQVEQRSQARKVETKMSFWSTLEADVTKGLEIAGAVVGVIPEASFLGPVLTEIATVIAAIEAATGTSVAKLPAAQVSSFTQAAAATAAVKQAAAKKTSS